MRRTISFTLTAMAFGLAGCKTPSEPETAPADWQVLDEKALASSHGKIVFATHVKPVLEAKCVVCHNMKTLPFFSLESRSLAFKSGANRPRIVPGQPEKSDFIVNATKAHMHTMPPVGDRLTPEEKRIFTAWVGQGAEWPRSAAGELHPRYTDGIGPMH